MPIVVFDMVALVFQGVKGFIFNLPPGTASFNQFRHIVSGYGKIRYPTVLIGGLSIFIDEPVLEKVNLIGSLGTVEGDVVDPLILMASPFSIGSFYIFGLAHSNDFIYPLKQNFMIRSLGYKDI